MLDLADDVDRYLDERRDEAPELLELEPMEVTSRGRALDEGALVDVTADAAAAGLRWPVAFTSDAFRDFAVLPNWRQRARRTQGAAEAARERRRVRTLMHVLVASIGTVRDRGVAAAIVETSCSLGRVAVDVRDRRAFRIDAPAIGGGRLSLLAAIGEGDAGEPVITVSGGDVS